MDTRRSFLKKTMLLSGAASMAGMVPASIQRALAIEPAEGSTFMDAEHIVFLMQENRSFDHAFGTLRGVRGFNDPRAIKQPDQNKVWLQSNHLGETYAPFRLDIKDTKITWMGSLPHGRKSQMDARNNGFYNNWLEAKKSGERDYENMPLTMGYYTRQDIPFYYALADAFTICDQNFCSSLTGTDPNRLYFWSGIVREKPAESARPFVQNEDVENGVEWPTFPERLEQAGISWKVYQNELAVEGGFTDEQDVWLGNFGDNPLEYFRQFNVKLSARYIDFLPQKIDILDREIKALTNQIQGMNPGEEVDKAKKSLDQKQQLLKYTIQEKELWTPQGFEKLSDFHKSIHRKAFAVNRGDPNQHNLEPLDYEDERQAREINVPRGDVLHQFRKDVESGSLPTVSWLVAPEYFSDHPSAPWFGSWYLSETMDILTNNPEIWKKTIFILAYDENDGYFDHIPPFTAPDPRDPLTGKASEGIDTSVEHVRLEKDSPGSIGLGYRVPLVIASPWTRGGYVNSQVFDHTSSLQFLEKFLTKKFGRPIVEPNISQWRRTICGNLVSVFRTTDEGLAERLPFLQKDSFIESVHKAKFKDVPNNFTQLTEEEKAAVNRDPRSSDRMPKQEPGCKPACALPYELYADAELRRDNTTCELTLRASKDLFGDSAAGSPFSVYGSWVTQNLRGHIRSYGVAAGDQVKDVWPLSAFKDEKYHLSVHGPNGFLREFSGDINDPALSVQCTYVRSAQNKLTGNIELWFSAARNAPEINLSIVDNVYKTPAISRRIAKGGSEKLLLDLKASEGWYDFTIKDLAAGVYARRYAGHVETGSASLTDPYMGGLF